jgi:all-trans-retinol 13,14-reductase
VTDQRQAIVIGSGAGGLFTALLLAQMDFQVTVIEKNRSPGGMMRSYRRRGEDLPVGIHYLGSMAPGQFQHRMFKTLGILDGLPLTRMGTSGPMDRYLLPEGRVFDAPTGIAAYQDALEAAFPESLKSIRSLTADLHEAGQFLDNLANPDAPAREGSWFLEHLRPIGERAREEGWSESLRQVLSTPEGWIGVPFDECPEYLYSMTLASYLSSAYRLDKGGAHLVDHMVARLRRLGSDVICGESVTEITIGSDKEVTGVRTAGGEFFPAGIVISSAHPISTLRLLPDEAVKPRFRSAVNKLFDTPGCFGMHALVDGQCQAPRAYNLFDFRARADMKTGGIKRGRYYQFLESSRDHRTLLSIIEADDGRFWQEWQDSQTGKRPDSYNATKEQIAQKLLADCESTLGALGEVTLLDAYTPLTIRDWSGAPTGSAYGVSRSSRQLVQTARLSRIPVSGLYLAGHSVTAPGMIGCATSALQAGAAIAGKDAVGTLLRKGISE